MTDQDESRPEGAWFPLLSPSAAGRAWEAIEAIAADLAPLAGRSGGPSLAAGQAGIALFFAYLDRARPGQGHGETAAACLEAAVEETIASGDSRPHLYGGFPGVAWTVEHLGAQLFEMDPEDDPGEDAAAAIAEHLARPPAGGGSYDLHGGLAGLGVYALERLPRPLGRECLERVVNGLAATAERRGGRAAWFTPPGQLVAELRERYPQGYYNLGLAHGSPGVVALLGAARAAGVPEGGLLEEAVDWLLAQTIEGRESRYAYVAGPGAEPKPARLAWCYGDLSVALGLLGAARHAGKDEWKRAALGLARFAATRPFETTGVVDAGLCHGAGGVLHLFNRAFQATGDPVLGDAALAWLERTLALRQPGEGVGGFLAFDSDTQAWQPLPGFLTGAAGTGLALLGAAAPVAPDWDRVLLTAVPPPAWVVS